MADPIKPDTPTPESAPTPTPEPPQDLDTNLDDYELGKSDLTGMIGGIDKLRAAREAAEAARKAAEENDDTDNPDDSGDGGDGDDTDTTEVTDTDDTEVTDTDDTEVTDTDDTENNDDTDDTDDDDGDVVDSDDTDVDLDILGDETDTDGEDDPDEDLETMDLSDKEDDWLRQSVRREGRRRKELEKEMLVKEAELAALESKVSELEAESIRTQGMKVDPKTHPDFKNKVELIAKRIDNKLLSTDPNISRVAENWGQYLEQIRATEDLERNDKAQKLNEIRTQLAHDMDVLPEDIGELDYSSDPDAYARANNVLRVFQDHTSDYDELRQIHDTLQEKAANFNLSMGYDEYISKVEPIKNALGSIESLTDKDIEADPKSLASIAAQRIKRDPKTKERAQKIDDLLISVFHGPEALSQDAIDRLTATGRDMNQVNTEREKRVAKARAEYAPVLKQLLLLYPEIRKALPEYFDTKAKQIKKEAEKAALSKASTKKAPIKKPEPEKPKLPTRDDMLSRILH